MSQKYVYNALTCEYDIIDEGAPGAPGKEGRPGQPGADGAPGADGVGVQGGGTAGQVLAKTTGDDFDTEWVDQTGGTTPSLDDVLGISGITDKNISITDGSNITLFLSYSGANASEGGVGAASITPNKLSLVNSGMSVAAEVSYDDSAYLTSVLKIEQNTHPEETIATREWVSDTIGGGAPELQDVLTAGNIASLHMEIADAGASNMVHPMGLTVTAPGSGSMTLNPTYLGATAPGSGNIVQLTPTTPQVFMAVHNGVSVGLMVPSGISGSSIEFPETLGPEIMATREWVSLAVTTPGRPLSPEVGRMVFDTSLGIPVWYDGAQWVDATGTGV